jgi:conjugative relaxase-like TrwC/TraI family protein
MLRIHTSENAAAAKTYYREGLTTSDYYVEKGEAKGFWGGLGAEKLGLSGEVTSKSFDRLADNLNPLNGEKLTPRTKKNRRVGYDFTFNAPKSVSILYGLGDMTMRRTIRTAFETAIVQTMFEIEQSMYTRVRKGGQNTERLTGNMVWGRFTHDTSRPIDGIPDPHLHTHVYAFNATFDQIENRWKAGEFAPIKQDAPYYEAVFHNHFASLMRSAGFGIVPTNNRWEVAGIPREILRIFSQRTQEIERIALEEGIVNEAQKSVLAAKTRASKTTLESPPTILANWHARYAHAGGFPINTIKRVKAPKPKMIKQVMNETLDHLFERSSTVPLKMVMQTALKNGVGYISQETIMRDLISRGAIINLVSGEQRVTLPHILQEEQSLIKLVKDGRGRHAKLVPNHTDVKDSILNPNQKQVISQVMNSIDFVTALSGVAGTGKTTVTKIIKQEIEKTGKKLIAVAPTSDASRGTLRKEGFEGANTVAKLLQDETLSSQLKDNILLVDEASQLGVSRMLSLLKLAKKQKTRVILSGDSMQHKAVERGDSFGLLHHYAGIPIARLNTIVRQTSSLYKNAVSAAHQGKMTLALEWLHTLEAFQEIVDSKERYQSLAENYFQATKNKQTALIVSPTHLEADHITPYIRDRLKQATRIRGVEQTRTRLVPVHLTDAEKLNLTKYRTGDIIQLTQNIKGFSRGEQLEIVSKGKGLGLLVKTSNEGVKELSLTHSRHFEIYQPKHIVLAKGDRIRITRNSYTKYGHHRLNNGQEYTIDRINQHGDLILNNGYQLHKEFNHLNYAYVSTSYASQSKTVDHIIIAQSSISFGKASSKEQFYVSLSRGRKSVNIYTDDVRRLKKELTKTNDHMSATELSSKKPDNVSWFNAIKSSKSRYLAQKQLQKPTMARPLDRPSQSAF